MRHLLSVASICCGLILLSMPTARGVNPATNLVTTTSQASGANWTAAIWKTNNGNFVGVGTAVGPPVLTNTYTCVSNTITIGNGVANTRLRPPTTGAATFPGASLTLQTNTEFRFKAGSTGNSMNFPGVNGNPGLILKGGMINGGDDATFPITGLIRVDSLSYISHGANGGGGGISANRAANITGQLTGSGNMVIMNAGTTIPQQISGSSNTYSGQWIVQCGWLVGNTTNALGTNSITVDPLYTGYLASMPNATSPAGPALFEPRATLNSAGVLTLTNGGRMRLHQEVCFPTVIVHDPGLNVVSNLSTGIHYYPELLANFPDVFDAGGSGAIVIQPFGTPPPLPPTIVTPPTFPNSPASPNSPIVYTNGTARFVVNAVDNGFPPLTYQWRTNGVNLTEGRFSGTTNRILVVTNAGVGEAALNYDVIVGNASFTVTSTVVNLTLVSTNGEAYEAAVQAAAPVAFYEFNDTGNPFTNNSPAYDLLGGYFGFYGTAVQNGFGGIAGPQAGDGFPGFGPGNFAAQFVLNSSNFRVSVLPWNLNTNTVTITAWIKPSGPGQNPNEGLVFCRGGATVAGLCYASVTGGASLGYNWNNESDTFNWNSGLVPLADQWSLVSLVVTPSKATIYILSTNTSGQLTLAASQHVYNHVSLPFDGTTLIGDDPIGVLGDHTFNGNIDDVGIFNRALSQSDLLALYSAASQIPTFGPSVAVPPASQALFQGQTAQFTGLGVGTAPLTYQWQSGAVGSGIYAPITDGGQFSGSATPTLTITALDTPNQLDYVVTVTNPYGSVTSSPPATLTVNPTNGSPINVTMTNSEIAGADWDIGANSPGANTNWSDFNPASYSAAQSPGNTYELLPGSRLRTPVGPVVANFPGQQLTADGDGVWRVNPVITDPTSEIRFKQQTYGSVSGVVNFRKLRMNGGQLDAGADAGNNNNMVIVGGEIDILANTAFNGDGGNDRGFRIDAFLTGANPIEYHAYNPANFQSNFVNNLNIAGKTNTFSGTWTVVAGTLLGTGTNALGTNNIFVGTNAAFETTYDLNSTNAYLVLGGKMYLHQNDHFRSAVVSGVSLPTGSNGWAALNASFPSNFPAVWNPQTGATNFSVPSGAIFISASASPLITVQPQSVTNRGQQTASFTVTAVGGLPLSYQWRAGATNSGVFTNLSNAGNISGATSNTITITNLSFSNGGDYIVVVTNTFGAVTSIVARLTELPLPFITLQPLSQTNSGLGTAQFVVSALGDLPLSYQWKAAAIGSGGPYTNINNGGQVSGATSNNMTIINLATTNSADYIVVITNLFGSATSTPPATLVVNDPYISQQPQPAGTLNVYQQSTAQWTVGALGTPPLAYQWQGSGDGVTFTNLINSAKISGANSLVLSISAVDFSDDGYYRFFVSNIGGSTNSSTVILNVLATNGAPAQNFTLDFPGTPQVQPQGADWNSLGYWNPGGDSASNSAPQYPYATYTVGPQTRLRSPAGATNSIFPGLFTPGIQLIVVGNGVFTNNFNTNDPVGVGEIRFKHANPGTNYIKQLVVNGGQLDTGDNGLIVIQGQMDVLANSIIYSDSASANDRGFRIESWLTGTGGIEYHDFDSSFSSPGGLNIAGATNTYSGAWHVVLGALIGSGANSLGTNSITVDNGGALETTYNLNNPNANLVLNGQMFLHQNDTFRTVTVGGAPVPPGFYTYAQWANSYPGSFPAAWNLQTGSAVSTASGSITVLVGPPINPIAMSVASQGGTNLVFSGTNGIPNGHYYVQATPSLSPQTWTLVGTFPFDGSGNFTFTNAISPGTPQRFFRMLQQVP